MKPNKATAVTLATDLSNLATYAALEVSETKDATEEGKPNPAAHVLPRTLSAVVSADMRMDKVWLTYTEAAHTAGLREAMLPPGIKYMSVKATPEYNLLYQTVAVAKFGQGCAALMGYDESIKADKKNERNKQQVSVGALIARLRGYLARFAAEAATAGEAEADAAPKAETKKRAARAGGANQAALDGETIVLLKSLKEAIKAQPHATMVLKAFVDKIDTLLDKAKASEAA